MSDFLDRLKSKPIPKKITQFEIKMPSTEMREGVTLNIKMRDRRAQAKLNRAEIMRNIEDEINVTRDNEVPDYKPLYNLTPAPTMQEPSTRIIKKKTKRIRLVTDTKEEKPAKQDDDQPTLRIKRRTRRPALPPPIAEPQNDYSNIQIGDEIVKRRLGKKKPSVLIRASEYYMNNRKLFVNFINFIFQNYRKELEEESKSESKCDTSDQEQFAPMTHQKIIRDYVNMYTPYRGLVLFHGLGAGKTCSSIITAEGLKSSRRVIVMTPASLRVNYVEELKKCGDHIYRKNQYWEFINIEGNPNYTPVLAQILNLPENFIQSQGGAWLVNIRKASNFDYLSAEQMRSLDMQINKMILQKYTFINYNGLRMKKWNEYTQNGEVNPFDNTIVVIDEAHNLVSRIINKLGLENSLSVKIYEALMDAENAKIIMLTGTPIINYPSEISVLLNIARGKIKTWIMKLRTSSGDVSQESIEHILRHSKYTKNIFDYVEYNASTATLKITRNPYGFSNVFKKSSKTPYKGVKLDDNGNISDAEFISNITRALQKKDIQIIQEPTLKTFKALPEDREVFKNMFIDDNYDVKNINLLKKRILGLTSYFKDIENLMPRLITWADSNNKTYNYQIISIPMSDFQFGIYEEARVSERRLEGSGKKKRNKGKQADLYEKTLSSYRIYSREFCNFVFPRPHIIRPFPNDGDDIASAIANQPTEDKVDVTSPRDKLDNINGEYDADDIDEETDGDANYENRIRIALHNLEEQKQQYLTPEALETYSPKFLHILENLQDETHTGSHLIYSQFRKLEGIGILKLVLETNGYAQFKITNKNTGLWRIDIPEADRNKPKFVLYTGTEMAEEKEIIRKIFNGDWDKLPETLTKDLEAMGENNIMGDIIKIFMITASGAEGISLRNVRYVHLVDPYWHPVRLEQVIGRARRICSHKDLPPELQTVTVYLYLMTFSDAQLSSDTSLELRKKDKGRLTERPLTSDEMLHEMATRKEAINKKLLRAIKEASIDCSLHGETSENLQCFAFSQGDTDDSYAYLPSIENEEGDKAMAANKKTIKWQASVLKVKGVPTYAYNQKTKEVFTLESYQNVQSGAPNAELVKIGHLVIEELPDGKKKHKIVQAGEEK